MTMVIAGKILHCIRCSYFVSVRLCDRVMESKKLCSIMGCSDLRASF